MIRVLEKHVADRIAAGEVVDRPLSVVKELVENSIDAGAKSIVVELRNGGKTYIRVTDDGCGISCDETEIAFARHATSKIENDEDLNSINTLGFRGEALASIAAVSRVELLTKTKEQNMGTKLVMHGGDIVENSGFGCPDGTTMVVSDLFYNTPARLKFMKADHTESSLIIDFVSQMALAYPQLRFRMINNGNILFSTNGRGYLYETIRVIYNRSIGDDLVEVDYTDSYLHIKGYVSAPMNSRTNRKSQVFFVNGRVVSSKVIDRGVSKAYSDRLFEGRYPICFLFLELEPDKLDVNIHPNKRDVRFDEEDFIAESVCEAIRNALDSKNAMAQVHAKDIDALKLVDEANRKNNSELTKQKNIFTQKAKEDKLDNNKTSKINDKKQAQVDIKNLLSTLRQDADFAEGLVTQNSGESGPNDYFSLIDNTLKPVKAPFRFEDLRVIGSVFSTYILACDDDTFYMIDQHAAHERCFFEKLLAGFRAEEKPIQPLLVPEVLEVSPAAFAKADLWLSNLNDLGFEIEEFGPNAFAIKAVPMFMALPEARDFVMSFIEGSENKADFEDYGQLSKIITRSCKSAVKGNDTLHPEEVQALLDELSRCRNPYSCPHGRPTFVRFTKYEMEKFFKRIQ